jgi:DNA-directed RNA polymerase specialized sigma24 family protein
MANQESVTEWLVSLKRGSDEAAQKLWQRYYEQLVRAAHRKLGHLPRRVADENDVAQEAFTNFFAAVQTGRFPRLDDRHDLWDVLLMLADRRAKDQMRKQLAEMRGGGAVRGESALDAPGATGTAGLGRLEDPERLQETVDGLIEALRSGWKTFEDETLCKIALDKLQGYENREIAERHGMALRAVERKLQLTRRLLAEEMGTTKGAKE